MMGLTDPPRTPRCRWPRVGLIVEDNGAVGCGISPGVRTLTAGTVTVRPARGAGAW